MPPVNDNIANARVITGTVSYPGETTVGATSEIPDPNIPDVWYRLEYPVAGHYDIEITNQSIGFNAIVRFSDVDPPSGDYSDFNGQWFLGADGTTTDFGFRAPQEKAGAFSYISVYCYAANGTTGTFDIAFTFTAAGTAPANDDFASAELVTQAFDPGTTLSRSTFGATTEVDYERLCLGTPEAVWFKLAPSVDATLHITITKTGGDAGWAPEFDIHVADTPTSTDCSLWTTFDDSVGDGTGSPPTLNYDVTAGTVYYLTVINWNYDPADHGTFNLTVVTDIPAPYWESWEGASISTTKWKGKDTAISFNIVDPNTVSEITQSTTWADEGTKSIKVQPSHNAASDRFLWFTDPINGHQSNVDYYLGYEFHVVDLTALYDAGNEWDFSSFPTFLRGIVNSPNFGSSFFFTPDFFADSPTTAQWTNMTGTVTKVINAGDTHEYRVKVTIIDGAGSGHWTVSEWWDGTQITNNVAMAFPATIAAPGGIVVPSYGGDGSAFGGSGFQAVYFDRVSYSVNSSLVTGLPPIAPTIPFVLGSEQIAAVFVDDVDISTCVLSGSVTRKLNRPWEATWRMPIDCSVQGCGSRVKVYIDAGGTTTLWFTGRITQISDECEENFCYTEYTALDAMEILSFRPVRADDGDFSKPSGSGDPATDILAYQQGPAIIEAMLANTEFNTAGGPPHFAEGETFITTGSFGFATGGVDLSGAPADWPMSIAELMTLLSDTGEVDIVLTPIDDPLFLAEIDVYNGNYGLNLSGATAIDRHGNSVAADGLVQFDYATGLHNVRIMRQTQDSTNVCNKLWYYIGPRIGTELDPQGDQHWCFNVTGDDHGNDFPGDPGLAYPPGGAITCVDTDPPCADQDVIDPGHYANNTLGQRRVDSMDQFGVRMEVKIMDGQGGTCGDSQAARELWRRQWQEEQWLRCVERTLVHITPVRLSEADQLPPGVTPVQIGDFDIGDIVAVAAGTSIRGGFSGAQRVYEYTVSWDQNGIAEISELLTSADQEGMAGT